MIPNDRSFNGAATVEDEGKTYYRFLKQGVFRLVIRVVAINSSYKQGIAFSLSKSPPFKGEISINGQKWPIDKKRIIRVIPVSLDEQHDLIMMDVDIKNGYLRISNASDFLDDYPELIEKISMQTGRTRDQFRGSSFTSGFTAAHMYGNAFWIEPISSNSYRFHCNDHKMDDDFDDLIFVMEIIETDDV